MFCFFIKWTSEYAWRISDWGSDVCSSDLAHVTDRQRFDIITRLCGDAVAGEREAARSENAALRILDVHVLDLRQVADIAGHCDEALILDRAGQIGVGSGRETVCQYVEVSVVGVG